MDNYPCPDKPRIRDTLDKVTQRTFAANCIYVARKYPDVALLLLPIATRLDPKGTAESMSQLAVDITKAIAALNAYKAQHAIDTASLADLKVQVKDLTDKLAAVPAEDAEDVAAEENLHSVLDQFIAPDGVSPTTTESPPTLDPANPTSTL